MNPPIGPQWVKPITQIVKEATKKATLDAWEETKRTWKSGFMVKYTEYLYSDWKRNLISLLALIQLFLFNACQWGIPLSIFFRKISMFGHTFENFTVVTFFFSKLQLILPFQEETAIIIATKKGSFVKSSSLTIGQSLSEKCWQLKTKDIDCCTQLASSGTKQWRVRWGSPSAFERVLFQSKPREINFSPSALPPCFPESYLYFCLNTQIAIISASPLLVGKCFLISMRYFYSLSNRPSSSLFILFFFFFLCLIHVFLFLFNHSKLGHPCLAYYSRAFFAQSTSM